MTEKPQDNLPRVVVWDVFARDSNAFSEATEVELARHSPMVGKAQAYSNGPISLPPVEFS